MLSTGTQLPERFGLLDESPQRWNTFQKRIRELNDAAPAGTQYKVFFFSRHGQGIRGCVCVIVCGDLTPCELDNVAEAKYGTKVGEKSAARQCT